MDTTAQSQDRLGRRVGEAQEAQQPHQHDVHERLVQGRGEIAEAVDALPVAQRLRQRAAQRQGCTQGSQVRLTNAHVNQ